MIYIKVYFILMSFLNILSLGFISAKLGEPKKASMYGGSDLLVGLMGMGLTLVGLFMSWKYL